MKKLTVAELKRLLHPGREFTAEPVLGPIVVVSNLGPTILREDFTPLGRRRVVKQGSFMVSVHLDGPKAGRETRLGWNGVRCAKFPDGWIVLADTSVNPPQDFLRIKL